MHFKRKQYARSERAGEIVSALTMKTQIETTERVNEREKRMRGE